MDNREEVRDFLRSRRARITPEQAGLPDFGGTRRVPGLRREEVALLAGMSVDYYVRLERGGLAGASDSVLESVSRVLQLDEFERAHLRDLARAAGARPRAPRRRPKARDVPRSVELTLESMTGAAAVVQDEKLDLIAVNPLGRALYDPILEDRSPNHLRFAFLDSRAREFWVDWERAAQDAVGALRSAAARDPFNEALTGLVGELSTRSEDFRTLWAAHPVHVHTSGTKRVQHAVAGRLDLLFTAMSIGGAPGLSLVVYSAEPQSPTADALQMLASWQANHDSDQVSR
jgi:hypothetical protein